AIVGPRPDPSPEEAPMEPFRVGFVPGVSPGKWFRRWEERYPDAPLAPRLVEVDEQRDLLERGALDMCFVRLPLDREGLHLLPDAAACPEWAAVADEVRDGTRVEPPPMTVEQAIEVAASGAGIVVVPMSVARLHQRKDVRYRPLTGVAHSRVGLAWLVSQEDPRVETFVGIVRGRTERSSRQPDADGGRPGGEPRQTTGGNAAQAGRHTGRGRAPGGPRRRGSPGPGRRR